MSELREVKAALEKNREEVKAFANKANEEISLHKDLHAETKEAIDKLLTESGEMQERLQDVEQKAAFADHQEEYRPQTAGEHVAKYLEDNPDAGAKLKQPERGMNLNIKVPRGSLMAATFTDTSTGGDSLVYPADRQPLVAPLVRRLRVRDLLMPGRTSSSAIFFPRESSFTNNADYQSEQGSTKEESTLEFEDVTRTVATIAHFLNVSLQMLADVPFLESYINGRLMFGLKDKEDTQFLLGSGVGNEIEGIHTAATAYSQPSGASVTKETAIDTLRLMLLQVELADAMASGIILHPTDWANIELLKDTQDRYLFTNPANTTTGRLWGRDVVSTRAMTQGNTVVGDFAAHAQIFDREDANVAISFENQANFEKNQATIRVEERTVLAIYRPAAFVKGALDNPSGE